MKLTLLRSHSHPRPDDVLALLLAAVIVVTMIGMLLIVRHLPSAPVIEWTPTLYPG